MTDQNTIGKKRAVVVEKSIHEESNITKPASTQTIKSPPILPVDAHEVIKSGIQGGRPSSNATAGLLQPSGITGKAKTVTWSPIASKADETVIQQAADQERRRNRPLLIIYRSNEKEDWAIGFDYAVQFRNGESSVNWKSLYEKKGLVVDLFYGAKNQDRITFNVSELEKNDRDGRLLHSFIGINAPGYLDADEAEGIGLIAASIAAGYLESVPVQEGQNLIGMLSADNRKIVLRHALVFSCRMQDPALVDQLLQFDANPNVAADDDGSTPLEIATQKGDIRLVQSLLKHGANPDQKLSSGETCRAIAAWMSLEPITALYNAFPVKKP